jgi:threonine synthase
MDDGGERLMSQIATSKRPPHVVGSAWQFGALPIVDTIELGLDTASLDGIKPVEAHTIAGSINVGKPRDGLRAVKAVQESKGRAGKVSDEKILAVRAHLPCETGVFAEPAGACAYAGFLEAVNRQFFSSTESVVVVNTGNGLRDIDAAVRTVAIPDAITPDFQSLKELLKLQ